MHTATQVPLRGVEPGALTTSEILLMLLYCNILLCLHYKCSESEFEPINYHFTGCHLSSTAVYPFVSTDNYSE